METANFRKILIDIAKNDNDERVFRVPGIGTLEHTAKIKIDYRINNDAFNASDFVIINI